MVETFNGRAVRWPGGGMFERLFFSPDVWVEPAEPAHSTQSNDEVFGSDLDGRSFMHLKTYSASSASGSSNAEVPKGSMTSSAAVSSVQASFTSPSTRLRLVSAVRTALVRCV